MDYLNFSKIEILDKIVFQNVDLESGYKETFRVFSKDDDGCIPAAEIRWAKKYLSNET